MTASAIMTANPPTLREGESVAEAAAKLVAHRYAGLPVADAGGRFLGMFGIYDLLSLLVPRVALAGDLLPNLRFLGDDPSQLRETYQSVKDKPVGQVCDRQAVTLRPDTPLIEVVRLFCRNYAVLAVVEPESGKIAGIVSSWDALAAIAGEGSRG